LKIGVRQRVQQSGEKEQGLVAMKAPLSGLAGFMMLALSLATARAQIVTCTQKMPAMHDGRLQVAVDALRAKFPDLVFQADDACQRAKVTSSALAATLRRNDSKALARFESLGLAGRHRVVALGV
jgi:hypothetical protein